MAEVPAPPPVRRRGGARLGALAAGLLLAGCAGGGGPEPLSCPELRLGARSAVPLDTVPIRGLPAALGAGIHARITLPAGDGPSGEADAEPVAHSFVSRLEDGGWILHGPLHPTGRLEGGEVRVQLRDSLAACPPLVFRVEPLPPAPGELERVQAALRGYLEAQAAAFGAEPAALRTARFDSLSPPLASLWMAQYLLDHPANPNSLREVARGAAPIPGGSDGRPSRAEALLARVGAADALSRLAGGVDSLGPAPAGTLDELRDALPARIARSPGPRGARARGPVAWLGPRPLRAAPAEAPGAVEMSARTLDWAMTLSLHSDLATSGRAGRLLKAFSLALGLEAALTASVAPATSENAGAMGLAAFAYKATAEAAAKLLPRRFEDMSYDLDPAAFEEDEDRTGHYRNVRVEATSGEWRADKFTLDVLLQAANLKQAGGLTGVFGGTALGSETLAETANALQQFVASGLLGELIGPATKGSGLTVGPRRFAADLSSPDWHEARIVGKAVQSSPGERAYVPRDVGEAELTVSTPPKMFGHQLIRRSKMVEVLRTEVELTRLTASFEPGDVVDLRAEVRNVRDTGLRFTASAGRILRAEEREEGVWRVRFRTPDDPEAYPVRVRAHSTADRSHLVSGGNPRYGVLTLTAESLVLRPAGACVRPREEQPYEALYPDVDLGEILFEGGRVRDPETLRWSASAGDINRRGVFTAPPRAGKVTIRARDPEDPEIEGSAVAVVRDCAWTLTVVGGPRTGFYWGREASLRRTGFAGGERAGSGTVLLTMEESVFGLAQPIVVTVGLDGVPPGEVGTFEAGGLSNQASVIFNDAARSSDGEEALGGLLKAAGPLASEPFAAYWTETPVGRGYSVETADGPLPLDRIHTLRGSFRIPEPAELEITANEEDRVAGRVKGEFLTLKAGHVAGPFAGDSAAYAVVPLEIEFDAGIGEHEERLETTREKLFGGEEESEESEGG